MTGRHIDLTQLLFSAAAAMGALALTGCATGSPPQGYRGDTYRESLDPSWSSHRFTDVRRQRIDYSCGATSLLTLLSNRFGETDLPSGPELTERMLEGVEGKRRQMTQGDGFSFLDLKRQLSRLGYQAIGVELPLAEMLELRVPAIVHLDLGETRHFATWRGAHAGRVMLGDPARGRVNYPVAAFAGEWTGRTLLVARKDAPPPREPRAAIRKRATSARGAEVAAALHRIEPTSRW